MKKLNGWLILFLFITLLSLVFPLSAYEQPAPADEEPQNPGRLISGSSLRIYVGNYGQYQLADPELDLFNGGALQVWYEGCFALNNQSYLPAEAEQAPLLNINHSLVSGAGTRLDPWQVQSQMKAVCVPHALTPATLDVNSTVQYVDGDNYLSLNVDVCGGTAGEEITTGFVLDQNPAGVQWTSQFNDQGCAPFNIVWDANSEPAIPTALQLVSVDTTSAVDPYLLWGGLGITALFVFSIFTWLKMLQAKEV